MLYIFGQYATRHQSVSPVSVPLTTYLYNHMQTTKGLAGVAYTSSSIQFVFFVKFGHMLPKLTYGNKQKQYGDPVSLQYF